MLRLDRFSPLGVAVSRAGGDRRRLRRPSGGRRRGWTALALFALAAIAGGLTVDVVTAQPASAHAILVATTPGDGERLESPPAEVTLEFSEGVSVDAGYVRVLGPGGERVDAGAPVEDGGVITAPLRSGLADASYTVSYRVVSEDAHPISGAYAFVVGGGELEAAAAVVGEGVDGAVGVALPVARWLTFAGVALVVGIPVFLFVCWPAGWTVATMRRLVSVGLVAVVVGSVLTFLLQGPYAGGVGIGSVLDPSLLSATAGSTFGATVLVRIACTLALAAVMGAAWRRGAQPTAPLVAVGGILILGLVATVAAVGHPAAGPLPGLAIPVTAVHVAAMAVWLGGLTALLVGVVRTGVPAGQLETALPRYSRLAFGAVAALVVTGIVQSVREVGSPTALLGTTYGWLLVTKLFLVVVLLAAAAASRLWVQQRLGGLPQRPSPRRVTAHAFAAGGVDLADDEAASSQDRVSAGAATHDLRPIRRSVLVEVAIGAVILAVSAVLVGTPPARSTVAEPVDVTLPLEGSADQEAAGSVQVTVDPAGTGPNLLHVYLFDEAGQLTQPYAIEVALSEESQGIGRWRWISCPGVPAIRSATACPSRPRGRGLSRSPSGWTSSPPRLPAWTFRFAES